jgi:NAD(P)H dehydrogenase (quinone)
MRVLTVYAHHDPHSLCHAILERFCAGLTEAGDASEIVDLYAIGFDPVLRAHDRPNWIDDSIPDNVLAHWLIEQSLRRSARGPLQRFFMKRWIGGRNSRQLVRRLYDIGGPADIRIQQEKVARAEALVFIASVYFWDSRPS